MCYTLRGGDNMNRKHTESQKASIIARYHAGETVDAISSDTDVPRSTIYSRIKKEQVEESIKKMISLRDYRLLENKVARLQGIIEILKKVECSANAPLDEKLCALESLQGQYSIHLLCEALEVPRGTFYETSARTLGTPNGVRTFVWKCNAFTMTAIRYSVPEKYAL